MLRSRTVLRMLWSGIVLVSAGAWSAGISDAAGRIQFGYYTRDHAVLNAAIAELEASGQRDPQTSLLLAYAHFSLADLPGAGSVTESLESCLDKAAAAADALPRDPEPRILIGVCAWRLMERQPAKALMHERRMERALATARALDYDNPRLALAEAWRLATDESRRPEYRSRLEEAASAFGETRPAATLLPWGEAEAYALLAAEYLADGDRRRARDAVEHALFVAPDYWRAVALGRGLADNTAR